MQIVILSSNSPLSKPATDRYWNIYEQLAIAPFSLQPRQQRGCNKDTFQGLKQTQQILFVNQSGNTALQGPEIKNKPRSLQLGLCCTSGEKQWCRDRANSESGMLKEMDNTYSTKKQQHTEQLVD